MGVCDQNHIYWRQVAKMQSGFPYPFQKKQPARKVRVNDDTLPTDLQEETGVSDEGDAQLTVRYQLGLVGLSRAWCDHGAPYQARKLTGPFAQRRIFQ